MLRWIPKLVMTSIEERLHRGSKLIDRKCSVLRKVPLPVEPVFLPVCWMDPGETAGAGGTVGVRRRKEHHYFSLRGRMVGPDKRVS